MRTENTIEIAAPVEAVYALAAEVERWPEFLHHYRWVKLLHREGNRKVVAMAARRDWIPVSWVSIQELEPEVPRMRFQHIGGFTRGMRVEWSFDVRPGTVLVAIRHEFHLPWPVLGRLVSDRIVGDFFVRHIAGQTLMMIKQRAEQRQSLGHRAPMADARGAP